MIDVGQTVGNYTVTAKLGEGGMGMVFLAEHPVIGSKVALKAIHPQLATNADIVSRFVTEARAVNQIGHDHIVNITDFGHTPGGEFYFVMEYLQGQTLADSIAHASPFAPTRALNIAAQIADALEASHAHGVVHRDLKPDNIILINRDATLDFVKVLDFGLAKLTHALFAAPTHDTAAGTVMGTPFYMAPEQCEGRAELDHRADVYALGIILFEMLTGRVPFGGESYGEVMVKHTSLRPPTARSLVPELPASMDVILARALAKDPAQRFQRMADFRAALVDPEGYASATPTPVIEDDVSGRLRAAGPTRRVETQIEVVSAPTAIERLPPPRHHGQGTPNVIEPPTPPNALERALPPTSTFRQSAGENVERSLLRPRRDRSGLFAVCAAALVVASVSSFRMRREAGQLVASAVALSRPATVRVNFSSDPDGATVSRADGSVLGVTPLSVEIPYGDAPVGYCVRKEGYAPKTSSVVPNLPVAVFAQLEREPRWPSSHEDPTAIAAAPSAPSEPNDDPPPPDLAAAAPHIASAPRHHHHAPSPSAPLDDGDGVLAPSEP